MPPTTTYAHTDVDIIAPTGLFPLVAMAIIEGTAELVSPAVLNVSLTRQDIISPRNPVVGEDFAGATVRTSCPFRVRVRWVGGGKRGQLELTPQGGRVVAYVPGGTSVSVDLLAPAVAQKGAGKLSIPVGGPVVRVEGWATIQCAEPVRRVGNYTEIADLGAGVPMVFSVPQGGTRLFVVGPLAMLTSLVWSMWEGPTGDVAAQPVTFPFFMETTGWRVPGGARTVTIVAPQGGRVAVVWDVEQ